MKYIKELNVRTPETILWPITYLKKTLTRSNLSKKKSLCNKIVCQRLKKTFIWNTTKYDIYNTLNSQSHKNIKASRNEWEKYIQLTEKEIKHLKCLVSTNKENLRDPQVECGHSLPPPFLCPKLPTNTSDQYTFKVLVALKKLTILT